MVRDWLDNTKARPSPRNVEAEMMEEAMTAEALANLEADSRKNAALSALSARQKMFRAKSMRKLERAKSVREMVAGLRDVGRLDEAENLARKILSARRQMYGNEHVATANAINQLGSVLTHKARYGDAMIEFQKAIACTRVALGPDSMCEANISHNQACVALMQAEQKSGDLRRLLLEEAARYGRKAADISERRLGVKHEKAQQMRRTWGL
jgi:tetratricopeptide (TPR) repeat protein